MLLESFEGLETSEKYSTFDEIRRISGSEICVDYMCPVISLSSFIELNSITNIDLLKIDVEGDELDTLIGLEDKISLVRQIVIGILYKDLLTLRLISVH